MDVAKQVFVVEDEAKGEKMTSTPNQKLDPIEQEKQLQQDPLAMQEPMATGGISVWMSQSPNNKINLNWTNPGIVGNWDYVALFDADPQVVGAKGYLTKQWQYVINHTSPYETGTATGTGNAYWIAYCTYKSDTQKYIVVSQSGCATVPPPAN